jgi:hypothetical protein
MSMPKILDKIINKLHWSFLLIFVIGYFATRSYFDFAATEYFIYNLLVLIACAIFIAMLKRLKHRNFAVWFSFAILILLYFVRAYWIVIDPTPVKKMLPLDSYLMMLEHKIFFLYAFKFSTILFTTFCIFSVLLLYFIQNIYHEKKVENQISSNIYILIRKFLWIILPPVALFFYFLINHYQIGFMGLLVTETLPFRLRGLVFYASTVVIPLLIALLIISAEKSKNMKSVNLGILFMIVHGIVLMVLRGSRSSLLLSLLLIVFLVIVCPIKLNRNQKLTISIFTFFAFFMVPIITIYRDFRINGIYKDIHLYGSGTIEALTQAILIIKNDLITTVVQGVKFIFFRMPGVESLWCMLVKGAQPIGHQLLDVFSTNNGVAGYLTYNIYSFEQNYNSLFAPSYAGWFYLTAGLFPGAMLSGVMAALISVIGWKFTNFKFIKSKAVMQVFLLWILFLVLTDGAIDIMGLQVISGIICIVFIECMFYLAALLSNKKPSN